MPETPNPLFKPLHIQGQGEFFSSLYAERGFHFPGRDHGKGLIFRAMKIL
jgi:hypothetical protein